MYLQNFSPGFGYRELVTSHGDIISRCLKEIKSKLTCGGRLQKWVAEIHGEKYIMSAKRTFPRKAMVAEETRSARECL